ncbi:topless-related protein 1 [Vitis vinifera]|nr:topless-related protein 1 [Vitis vinifera]|eukprot:XP_010648732.1 PREDICTED: topless-related protein 1-like [Vitis vinifera]
MSSLRRDCISLILKYLQEENFTETAHSLERQSGIFFNLNYVEELVMNGEWEEAEMYLSGFTKLEDNKFSTKIFFEIRKQKYLETLDRNERLNAVEILMNDLKVFSRYNNDLFKEMALLITLDDFRKHKSLGKYGDTLSARASILREIKKAIGANPVFVGKMELPAIDTAALRSLANEDA